ncbi:MAG TPA: biotin carboxylase N-terminal domain-containing protein [Egicoccus sp.]|nr:biotin carboxylase N-terminal domain-containing protein [Egicoccus sp.]HSK22616.1 biotin carboxylase N-terminal domain-containing protein [Egicoccus sp.]
MEDIRLPRKVLIANRGEIAVRVARTCRAMGIATVAVHSDADTLALHVEVCDEAVRIGGTRPADSYLRSDLILDAAARTGADAIHPGYGFLSENADFARTVLDAGITWIGPSPDVIAAMGDKIEAKRRMAAAGVPLVPGADLPADVGADEVAARAAEVGFPVMVKAAAGGGGKGMRVVHDPADLADAVAAARREAASAFGDDRIFLERFVTRPRHLEVQVLGDGHGNVVHLFERECSIQRRHQKVIEEAPSVAIDAEVRAALTGAAVAAARAIGYVNAGTIEFVADERILARRRAGEDVDPREAFAFLEVNTRLQVEHPVTEQTVRVRGTGVGTAIDLVRLQILVAAGAPLPFAQDDLVQVGHAIEGRLYAENPAAHYRPSPGTLHLFEPAGGDGIRWDNGARAGDHVSPDYDPMLAKAIGTAATRPEAAARLAAALEATLTSGATNKDLLVAVLRDEAFLAGDTTTAYLDERFATPASRTFDPDDATTRAAMMAAALHATLGTRVGAVPAGIPQGFTNGLGLALPVRLGHRSDDDGDRAVRVERSSRGLGWWSVVVGPDLPPGHLPTGGGIADDGLEVLVHGHGPTHVDIEVIDGVRQRIEIRRPTAPDQDPARHEQVLQVRVGGRWVALRSLPRFPHRAVADAPGTTTAPMPGTVTTVAVAAGDTVARGDLLVTIEAMKMEHRVTADVDGTVTTVAVLAGQQVDADAILVVVEIAD